MKTVATIVFILVYAGCSTMQDDLVRSTCSLDGAYQLGMRHAKEAKREELDFVNICKDIQPEVLIQGYRGGYRKGMGGGTEESEKYLSRSFPEGFWCTQTVNGKIYKSKGPTLNEALRRVREKCLNVEQDCSKGEYCAPDNAKSWSP